MSHERQFAETLDACLDQLRRGRPIGQILKAYPDDAEQLRPLLELSQRLERVPQPNLSMEGMMRTLGRLGSEVAADQAPAQQPKKTRWLSRAVWARAAAVVLVVFFVGWGSVNASADSTPGDLLYPVKLFTERARFFLTLGAEDRAELRIVFSSRRLKEAVIQQQRTGQLDPQLLSEMLEEARLAVLQAPELSGPMRSLIIAQATHLTDYQYDALGRLVTTAGPQEQQVISRYRDMCRQRRQWMGQMLPGSGGASQGYQRPSSQASPRHWRQWRDACPMW